MKDISQVQNICWTSKSLVDYVTHSLNFVTNEQPQMNDNYKRFNSTTPGVHKMVKRTLNILQHLLQHFKSTFDHFVHTRR